MKINLNEIVTVRLTEAGMQVWRQFYRRLEPPEGPVRLPLWELAQVFGTNLHVGCPLLFHGNAIEMDVAAIECRDPEPCPHRDGAAVDPEVAARHGCCDECCR